MRLRLIVFISFFFPITALAEVTVQRCETAVQSATIPVEGSTLISQVPKFAGKVLVFDTNVIMNDPFSIYKYPGAQIIIPGAVMNEIDNHKKDPKTGRAVRAFSRIVDELIKKHKTISRPAPLDAYGTTLMVDPKNYMAHLALTDFEDPIPDNRIIATALQYVLDTPNYDDVYLVSDDINARVKASSVEVQVMGSEYEWVNVAATHEREEQQIKRIRVSAEELEKFKATGQLKVPEDTKLLPNEFAMVQLDGADDTTPTVENVIRYVFNREEPKASILRAVLKGINLPFPPKNVEQAMALDLLLDPTVELVISEASAGTGKTFISMMAGIMQTRGGNKESKSVYEQLIVSRTLVHVGKTELGTLPGGVEQKLAPFNENYADAWSALNRKKNPNPNAKEKDPGPNRGVQAIATRLQEYNGHLSEKKIYRKDNRPHHQRKGKNGGQPNQPSGGGKPPYELLAFPNIRGRSINDSFIILDEAQNTSMHEMKTFLTRAGEGTKMVLLGDASQVDAPFLNEYNNGLKIVSSLVKSATLSHEERSRVGTIKLTETVRSELAELMVKLFDSAKNE
ncbi:MAG: PhoH family protein [Pseudobdellovibrionaceae bacterium]